MKLQKPLILIVLDGWGIGKKNKTNAIHLADTPIFDRLIKKYSSSCLSASSESVGLPPKTIGGSEVGHLHIGSGRLIAQDFTKINRQIKNRRFFTNKAVVDAVRYAQVHKSNLHLMGLLSDGGVHSHISHLFAVLDLCKKMKFQDVYIHCFLDGRDVLQQSALKYLDMLQEKLNSLHFGHIATVMGRYYAMDRDQRWKRTKKAYDSLALGRSHTVNCYEDAVEIAYFHGETDEFVEPTKIRKPSDRKTVTVNDKDSILFFNFRADRARQLTQAFCEKGFDKFKREPMPNLRFTQLYDYNETFRIPTAYTKELVPDCFGEIISDLGMKQIRIAESEKGPHVTFFFSGQEHKLFRNEHHDIVPSPKVSTYDQRPQMSAKFVKNKTIDAMNNDKYDFILTNFANADMVGHTGNMDAAIEACTFVDNCLGEIVERSKNSGYTLILTADHGNSDCMIHPDGTPHTAHTFNPVPFIIVDEDYRHLKLKPSGNLYNIAPTILKLSGLKSDHMSQHLIR